MMRTLLYRGADAAMAAKLQEQLTAAQIPCTLEQHKTRSFTAPKAQDTTVLTYYLYVPRKDAGQAKAVLCMHQNAPCTNQYQSLDSK